MYYKLTDKHMQTYGGFQWELGKWERIADDKRMWDELCTCSFFHCYDDPLIAIFRNPCDANIKNPRLFIVNVKGAREADFGLKYGFTMMRLKEEINVPVIAAEQQVKFGILCAMQVHKERWWTRWAKRWLDGTDRSYKSSDIALDKCRGFPFISARYASVAAKSFATRNSKFSIAIEVGCAAGVAAGLKNIDLPSLARQSVE